MSNRANKRNYRRVAHGRKAHLTIALIVTAFLLTSTGNGQERQSAPREPNEDFVLSGFEKFADSIVVAAEPHIARTQVLLQVQAVRFQERLTNMIAVRLQQELGSEIFLQRNADAESAILEAALDGADLAYVGIGRGFLRFPAVERRLQLDGYGRVLDDKGKLLNTFAVANLVFSDTLSYADAEAASGQTAFLKPPLPPSPYKRLVEPGLVLTITGALVYLFFASR